MSQIREMEPRISRFKKQTEERMRDSLRAALMSRGVVHAHTQARDLEFILPSGKTAVIEIKKNALHDSAVHSVYEALGQLYYHTRAIDLDAVLVVAGPCVRTQDGAPKACYGETSEVTLRERLAALGVHLLLAEAIGDRYTWHGLEELLAI